MGDSDQQNQTQGQSDATRGAAGDQTPAGGQSAAQQTADAQTQTQTPATQAKGVALKLSQEQIDRLLKDGTLELDDEHFTGAVKERIAQLTARAKAAERRLSEIAAAREAEERKALEEQERFKELYEQERQAREKERQARTEEAVRSRFLLAAAKAGVVDPEAAYLLAKALPVWEAVQVTDEGAVSGIDDALKTLVEEKPYLISRETKPQSVGAPSNPSQQPTPAPKSLAEAGDELERRLRTGI